MLVSRQLSTRYGVHNQRCLTHSQFLAGLNQSQILMSACRHDMAAFALDLLDHSGRSEAFGDFNQAKLVQPQKAAETAKEPDQVAHHRTLEERKRRCTGFGALQHRSVSPDVCNGSLADLTDDGPRRPFTNSNQT